MPKVRSWKRPQHMKANSANAKAKKKSKQRERQKQRKAEEKKNQEEEKRKALTTETPPWKKERASSKPVCTYHAKGFCKYADRCWMAHPAGDLNSLGADTAAERVNIVVDSGASTCALPQDYAKDYPVTPDRHPDARPFYTSASGQHEPAQGCRTPVVELQDGTKVQMSFTVMDVRRPLAAVSRIVATGHRVVFDAEEDGGSYIENKSTGKWHKLHLRDGVYVLPGWIKPASSLSGFARQARP